MKAKNSLIIVLLIFLTAQTAMSQIEGYWKGEIDLGVQKLETAFDIKAVENGYSATLSEMIMILLSPIWRDPVPGSLAAAPIRKRNWSVGYTAKLIQRRRQQRGSAVIGRRRNAISDLTILFVYHSG